MVSMIPKFESIYSTSEHMNLIQKTFFSLVKLSLNHWKPIKIDGNISYIFAYVNELIENRKEVGYKRLSKKLIFLSESYSSEKKLSFHCETWALDALLYSQQYKTYLEMTEPEKITGTSMNSNFRLNLQYREGIQANPVDLLLLFNGRSNNFINENMALYKDKIFQVFNDYTDNWFEFMINNCKRERFKQQLFLGTPSSDTTIFRLKIFSFHKNNNIKTIISDLSKEAENLVREELGLPKIGEGWISETTLFKKIKEEFSYTKVIQHGQPYWLGRQHYDIWLPYWKIAVEYHGRQHFEPVEFFGGEDAFKKNIERDKRKIRISRENEVELLIVKEGYNFLELAKEIRKIRSNEFIDDSSEEVIDQ